MTGTAAPTNPFVRDRAIEIGTIGYQIRALTNAVLTCVVALNKEIASTGNGPFEDSETDLNLLALTERQAAMICLWAGEIELNRVDTAARAESIGRFA